MKNNRVNLVAALTFGMLIISGSHVCAKPVSVTENANDEIEIITVKDGSSSMENIFNENVLNVKCPVFNFGKPVSPRVRTTQSDYNCETGAALPPPCPCEAEPAPCIPEPVPCDPCAKPEPCDVSPACPIADPCDPCEKPAPCDCDPCAKPDPCDVSPACPIAVPCDPCKKSEVCPVAPCEKNCGPACATSPSIDKDGLNRLQVYAYPRYMNLWGNDLSSNANMFNNGSYGSIGAVVANNNCGCANSGLFNHNSSTDLGMMGMGITGAAAGIPVQNNPCLGMAIPVDNSVEAHANHGCPVTIHTSSSIQVPTMGLEKLDVQQVTGAAVPLINSFDDVPSGYWASDDINRLSASKVIQGYPDQTFRPDRKVTRAEFAALAVSGLNYQGEKYYDKPIFTDVPQRHWANSVIDKGVNGGLITGYPDGKFKPNNHVTRAEALTILAKALPSCDMDDCKANDILSNYEDGATVPAWARVPVAKALQANALKKSPDCNKLIRVNDYATRAEIASMLANIRIAMGIDPAEIACGASETGAAAYVQVEEMKQFPTLKVKFDDQITAKDSQAGDGFRAYSTECVTIDGVTYPAGSIVRGKIVEVIRPSHNCKGGLKIAFTEIENGDNKALLPQEVLSAQVLDTKNPNIIAKILKTPFTWAGAIVGNTARTVGGFVVNAGNGVEAVANDFGTGTGELFQGKFKAAFRSYGQSALEVLKTPVQMAAGAVSGVAGLAEVTVDDIAYIVSPNGTRISQISPNEVVQIAFGTCSKTASK